MFTNNHMMKTIIILLLLIITAYSFEQDSTNQKGLIANGVEYDPKEFPYVVTLIIFTSDAKDYMGTCTGTLVRKDFVLTAAHCIFEKQAQNIEVYPGTIDKNTFHTVKKIYMHENYNNETDVSDLCFLQLETPFPQVKQFIDIGGHPDEFANNKALICTNIGFGSIDNKGTMGKEGRRMDGKVTYGPKACKLERPYWRQYLCSAAGTRTMTCPGDSGGPMICNGKLYGVCSTFYNYKLGPNKCGSPDMQNVHMFLHYHLKWINNILGVDNKKKKKKKKKKKQKKKNSGNSLKPHLTMNTILAILFCIVY